MFKTVIVDGPTHNFATKQNRDNGLYECMDGYMYVVYMGKAVRVAVYDENLIADRKVLWNTEYPYTLPLRLSNKAVTLSN